MKSRIYLLTVASVGVFAISSCGTAPEEAEHMARPAVAGNTAQPPPAKVGQKMRTPSGLEYEVMKVGSGVTPRAFDKVKVHYHGYLPDTGEVFDSSVQRGEPTTFYLNQVIQGWTEGVQLMQEGSKYRFTIPHYLAYGEQGSPPKIGPRQTLMFEVELIQVIR